MAGLTYIKDGGVWKLASALWVKDAGTWRAVDKAWLKQGGEWKEIFTAAFVFNDTISSYMENYRVRTRALAAGWDGTIPLIANITLAASAGQIGSNSTGAYAFDTGPSSDFPASAVLNLTIQSGAWIRGRNGPGGSGAGGPAFRVQVPINVANYGDISGAGGGGANGWGGTYPIYSCDHSSNCFCTGSCSTYGGSGGRGAGCLGGAHGGSSGSWGTCGGGNCGAGYGNGYSGGDLGQYGGGGGGAPGYAVVGNSLINWINTGTINGPVS
ncbi:MAG: hypothetical protein ACK4FJ_18565 [Ferrovibrio sp.]|uniref:hypothetical protein n=1 Tax=Ferrovibrio sp. TaxID=1917215 RepID=UPI003919135C